MNAFTSKLRVLKHDLLPRYGARLRRLLRIAGSYGEYRRRIAVAASLPDSRRYDWPALRDMGYTLISPASPDGDILQRLVKAAREKFESTQDFTPKDKKVFFSQLLDSRDLALSGVFVQFALQEELLAAVARYLGCAPYLETVELLYSRPTPTFVQSQLWHKDRTDTAIVKVWVYILEVTEENGPFSFLSAKDSDLVPDNLEHYLTDERISRYVPLSRTIAIVGPPGESFMIDTNRCFHFGSRCMKPRLGYAAYYTSGFGFYPRETAWKTDGYPVADLSPLQKLAIGA